MNNVNEKVSIVKYKELFLEDIMQEWLNMNRSNDFVLGENNYSDH